MATKINHKYVIRLRNDEKYIIDILQSDYILCKGSYSNTPSLSDLFESFLYYAYFILSDSEIKKEFKNIFSGISKHPLPYVVFDESDSTTNINLNILHDNKIEFILPKTLYHDFSYKNKTIVEHNRIIAIYINQQSYETLLNISKKILNTPENANDTKFQAYIFKTILRMFLIDSVFRGVFRDFSLISYYYDIPITQIFSYFYLKNTNKDLKELLTKDIPLFLKFKNDIKNKNLKKVFMSDTSTFNSNKSFDIVDVFLSLQLITMIDMYIDIGDYNFYLPDAYSYYLYNLLNIDTLEYKTSFDSILKSRLKKVIESLTLLRDLL